jgi:hypothetical protein
VQRRGNKRSLLYGTEAERLNALDAAVIAAFARSPEEIAPVV